MMLHKQPPGARRRRQPGPDRLRRAVPGRDLGGVRARASACELVEVYGMTEAPMGCENRLDNRKIGSAGRESMTYEVRIVDENDEPVPPDTPGEIVIRPKHRRRASSASTTRREATRSRRGATSGSTPATARTMDEDGFLFFLDRMKDCDPPARREHLVLGGRVDDQHAPGGARVGRLRRRLRALRVGRDGRGRAAAGSVARARGAARLLPGPDGALRDPALRPLHGRAAEERMPSGSRSSSCATRASPRTPGTARSTATRCAR